MQLRTLSLIPPWMPSQIYQSWKCWTFHLPAGSLEKWQTGAAAQPLHKLLCLCGIRLHPQDMRDANIVTVYKTKDDRSDCNNYRGISLLNIVGKAFAVSSCCACRF